MKDAYSFDCDVDGMEASYKKMYDAYCRIFERCGLPYIAVEADPGMMGGSVSHEFMVPAEAGEDRIVTCKKCGYAASDQVAKCEAVKPPKGQGAKRMPIAEVETPGITTIEKVSELLKTDPTRLVKTLIYKADGKIVALLIRGDLDANETKLKNFLRCEALEMADEKTIELVTGAPVGFSGPVNLKGGRIVADLSVKDMMNFITGANKKDAHLINVNPERDFQTKEFADFRMITPEDRCPVCGKAIDVINAIEVGHTFKLGTKYSAPLGARFLDKDGKEKEAVMGCYGIGVNRIAASLIETSNDKDGIVWPASIAPYEIIVIALNVTNEKVSKIADSAYKTLTKAGYDVLYDNRDESAGKKFKDADLIGIPVKVIVGEKNAAKDIVEVKSRKTGKVESIPAKDLLSHIKSLK
jgi:prolyl-tRNA synthetase